MIRGSYHNGFAPRDGMPLYPSLWQGCVGAWAPCLGPTGLTLFEWSGYRRHAIGTASPTFDVVAGGYATTYNGTTQYHTATLGTLTQPFSISFWAYRTSYASLSHAAIAISGSGGSVCVIYPYDTNGGNGVRWFFAANLVDQNSGAAAVGWNHYCAVSRSATDHEFFVNGASIGTSTTSASLGTSLICEIGTFAAAQFYSGSLDDIRIYNRVLNRNQILQLSRRRGIAYDLAPFRMPYSEQVAGFQAAWALRQRLILGGGGGLG